MACGTLASLSPREIARFLGTLRGGGGYKNAIEVMRARFLKLRNLLDAHPEEFVLHPVSQMTSSMSSNNDNNSNGVDSSSDYEVSLVLVGGIGTGNDTTLQMKEQQQHRSSFGNRNNGDTKESSVSLLDEILPNLLPGMRGTLPPTIGSLLDQLGLTRKYESNFTKEEFRDVPTILLCTEDDLKDIGLPVGPRVKIRNWIESRKYENRTDDAA